MASEHGRQGQSVKPGQTDSDRHKQELYGGSDTFDGPKPVPKGPDIRTIIIAAIVGFVLILGGYDLITGQFGILSRRVTISYDYNDGSGNVKTVKINPKKPYTLIGNDHKKTGYSFAGWLDDSGAVHQTGSQMSFDRSVSSVTYKAKWQPLTYKVTFNSGSGTGFMVTQYFDYESTGYLNKNMFRKQHYKFKYWQYGSSIVYDQADLQSLIAKAGLTNRDIILTAVWDLDPSTLNYTVTCDANGGKGEMTKQTCSYNTTGNLKANTFKKKYYKFKGWKYGSNTISNKASLKSLINMAGTTNTSITLKASWAIDKSAIKKDIKVTSKYTFDSDSGKRFCITTIKNKTKFKLNVTVKYNYSKGKDYTDYINGLGPKKSTISWTATSSKPKSCKVKIKSIEINDTKNYSNKIKIKVVKRGSKHWKFKITNNTSYNVSGYYGLFGKGNYGAFAVESIEFDLKPGKSKTYTSLYSYSNHTQRHFKLRSYYFE